MALIPRSRVKDLMVLYYLCTTQSATYDSISNHINISARTCKEIVKRINESVALNFQITNFIVPNKSGKIHLNHHYNQNKFEIFFRLQLLWYKDFPMTKLIILIVEKHNISREEAQAALYLSESSFNKLLPKLNKYLKSFEIIINSSDGLLSFEGNEISIRNFLFKFLYYTYLNIEWPFSEKLLKDLTRTFPLTHLNSTIRKSDIRVRSYYIAAAVFLYRFSTHHFIQDKFSKDIVDITNILYKFNPCTDSLFNQNSLFPAIEGNSPYLEKFCAELFFRNYVPEIDSEQLQTDMGQEFVRLNKKTTKLAQKLIEQLDIEFQVVDASSLKHMKIYQLVIFLSLVKVLDKTFLPFVFMHTPKHPYLTYSKSTAMEKIAKVTAACDLETNETTDVINRFLYSLYSHELQKKIYLYLEFSKDQTAPYYIKNKISSIYSEKHILFTPHYEEADLVISDTFDLRKNPETFFYLLGPDDRKGWSDLLFRIQKISIDKNFGSN